MEIILGCCAGMDVHKDSVEVCVRRMGAGGKVEQQVRHWGTMTRDLMDMSNWLKDQGVTHVAMESTGCTGSRCSTFWRRLSRFCWPTPAI